MLAALLDHGKPLRIDERGVELGFPPDSLFLESAQDRDNVKQLGKLFEEFFGRSMRLSIVPLGEEDAADTPPKSPAEEGTDPDGKEHNPVRNPLVNEALSIFDGKIVEIKSGDGGREG